MKKLSFLLVVAMLLSFASHAASIYRELHALNGNPLPGFSGVSTVSMTNSSASSPFVEVEMGDGFSNSMTAISMLTITFDADASSSGTTTWNVFTTMISTTSYSQFTIGNDHLYIKRTGLDRYSYYCVYIP